MTIALFRGTFSLGNHEYLLNSQLPQIIYFIIVNKTALNENGS